MTGNGVDLCEQRRRGGIDNGEWGCASVVAIKKGWSYIKTELKRKMG